MKRENNETIKYSTQGDCNFYHLLKMYLKDVLFKTEPTASIHLGFHKGKTQKQLTCELL